MELRRSIELCVMAGAALLEVGGDAVIRKGMRGAGVATIALGFAIVGAYGVLVNILDLDFSRLLGAYVGVFAITGLLFGALVFRDRISTSTWIGAAIVLVGSLVIHFGSSASGVDR